jgi:hypothetical protein
VLEPLPDPAGFLAEVGRVLHPGGRAVVSHTDFDALLVNTADIALTRRVLHGYADLQQPWMAACDGRMGRRLPALVRASPLRVTGVETHTVVETSYSGHACRRLAEVVAVLRASAIRGGGPVDGAELDAWERGLRAADATGEFCFAEIAFVVSATRD